MNLSAAKYWMLLACMLATMYGTFLAWRLSHEETHADAPRVATSAKTQQASPPLQDFALTDQDGKSFDSRTLLGKPWVGSFFFTNCPAVCWRLNQTLAAMQETSPDSEIRYVSITCDPDNDTPAALTKYANHFKADPKRWTFLTGDMDLIRRIGNDYFHVGVDRGTHSDRAFAVDRKGQVRAQFRLTEPDQVEMLKKLLVQLEAEPIDGPAAEKATDDAAKPAESNAPRSDPATPAAADAS